MYCFLNLTYSINSSINLLFFASIIYAIDIVRNGTFNDWQITLVILHEIKQKKRKTN